MSQNVIKMDGKSTSNNNIEQYFTADAWTALSLYEKRRYENVLKKCEILKASGITPKMPEFMMTKFKRPRKKATDGQPKGDEAPKAQFKLFAIPNQAASKRMNSNKGAGITSDISVVMETDSPSSKMMTSTFITFRDKKPNVFGNKILNSAETALKVLENLFQGMDLNNILDDMVENLSEPDFSKDIEPKHRYPKRNVEKKCYFAKKEKQNVKDEDEFLYCEICEKEYKGPCPVHGAMLQVLDTQVPKGDPNRAKRTLPFFFSIGISSLPKAGVGVWTEMPLIAGMVFGPFEGKILKKNEIAEASEYSWEVTKQSKLHHCVDASDASSSNWMRYVNCADYEEWQNMVAFQYQGKIYYRTYKPVLPYSEILIWYGDVYASKLGIEVKEKKCLELPKEIAGYPCDVCNSLFSSSESLRRHRKMHPPTQDDRRHRCPECSYSSNIKTAFRYHLLTHSGEKPHACTHCSKRFTQKSHLRTHLLLHTNQKKHTCSSCGKQFTSNGDLTKHERVHSRERPYRCPDCGKDFSQATDLKRHRMLHNRQRPYPCPHCECRFARKDTLTKHIARKHTREFLHSCSLCRKGFHTPGELKKHEQRHHLDITVSSSV